MTRLRILCLVLLALLCLSASPLAPSAFAHPEDELCTPGSGLDPELCRALSDMDRGGKSAKPSTSAKRDVKLDRPLHETFFYSIKSGFAHILPGGLDHIFFVLALFLSSQRLKPLLWQISAFTIAHTATLALAAAGLVSPLPSIVEPLIALTIAWAAIENILFKEMKWWRPALVFGFGLIHGLGFANVFSAQELPAGLFWICLAGFNLGVEFGQLAFLGMAFAISLALKAILSRMAPGADWRRTIVWPVSAGLAAMGLWWAVSRAFNGA